MKKRMPTPAEVMVLRAEGFSYREAAARLGVARMTAWRLVNGDGRRSGQARKGRGMAKLPEVVGDGPDYPDIDPDDKDALIERLKLENAILRGMQEILKGVSLSCATNREKSTLIDWLRQNTGHSLRELTGFLRISKSSYEYWRARAGREDKYARLRGRVVELFGEGRGNWGYRTVWARLRRGGTRVSEKVVRRIMREEGLEVVYNKRRRRGWSSYEGEVSKAPENLVDRDFRAGAPDELWLTDITEFGPWAGGPKVYLSPVIDCYDGMPVSWSIGLHPDKALANSSLESAVAQMRTGAKPVIHSDRGGHYRWPEWIAICEEHGLVRSMSAKGCSPDNSACEGFFGRLKNEFFHYRDWSGVGPDEFMRRLDAYMRYYREGRIKRSLGWMSPCEYRASKGYAV